MVRLNIFYINANYKKFSSKSNINKKKISILDIIPANRYVNLNQPLIQSILLEDNTEIVGVYASKKYAGLHLYTNYTTLGSYIWSGIKLFNRYLITKAG